jgi:hypothetical protein
MVERIYPTQHEFDIALRVDIVQSFPSHLADVLHVHFFIHHHDALTEHRLARSPDGVHDFPGMARIGFPDCHQNQVMKNAFGRQNLSGRAIALVSLSAVSWPVIEPHVAKIINAVDDAKSGSFTRVDVGRFRRPSRKPKGVDLG